MHNFSAYSSTLLFFLVNNDESDNYTGKKNKIAIIIIIMTQENAIIIGYITEKQQKCYESLKRLEYNNSIFSTRIVTHIHKPIVIDSYSSWILHHTTTD